ncbi:MAG: hypothetical protein NT062_15460 [Proteobacteria bacterium]|nr:hypothetical protein [Pseudomonadota bacterium]
MLVLGILGLGCLSLTGCATESTETAAPFGPGGGKSDGGSVTLAGVYAGPEGATLFVDKGDALVLLPDGNQVSGLLSREGTLGGAYTIDVKEGTVCGTYRISLWESEGVLGDGSRVELSWVRPQGSVVQQCGFMLAGEGEYLRQP